MRKIRIKYQFLGEEIIHTAVLADDLSHPIPDPDNEALGVVDGVADQLGIWSIYFDHNKTEVDFVCKLDEDGFEVKTLEPVDVFVWDEKGKPLNESTTFTVEEL